MGPLEGPGPHLSSPVLPWLHPGREKSLCCPSGASTPPQAPQKGYKKVPKSNQRRRWPQGMPKGPWGPWTGPGLRRFPMRRIKNPLVMPTNGAARRLQTKRPHAEVREFRPSTYPAPTAPIGTPGGGAGWKCIPRAPKCCIFQKQHCRLWLKAAIDLQQGPGSIGTAAACH